MGWVRGNAKPSWGFTRLPLALPHQLPSTRASRPTHVIPQAQLIRPCRLPRKLASSARSGSRRRRAAPFFVVRMCSRADSQALRERLARVNAVFAEVWLGLLGPVLLGASLVGGTTRVVSSDDGHAALLQVMGARWRSSCTGGSWTSAACARLAGSSARPAPGAASTRKDHVAAGLGSAHLPPLVAAYQTSSRASRLTWEKAVSYVARQASGTPPTRWRAVSDHRSSPSAQVVEPLRQRRSFTPIS